MCWLSGNLESQPPKHSGSVQACTWIACLILNPWTPNDLYISRTAPLTSKRCILYIYSTNIGVEYFKHAPYSPFFSSSKCNFFHNANLFGSCIIHILYTGCAEIKKKNNSGAKGLNDPNILRGNFHEVKISLLDLKLPTSWNNHLFDLLCTLNTVSK